MDCKRTYNQEDSRVKREKPVVTELVFRRRVLGKRPRLELKVNVSE